MPTSSRFTPEWISTGIELPPLAMPLRREPYAFPDLPTAHLLRPALPPGRRPPRRVRQRAGQRLDGGAGGAVRIDHPARPARLRLGPRPRRAGVPPAGTRHAADEPPTAVALADLVQAARLTVHGELASRRQPAPRSSSSIQVGTSAGGARAKAVVAFNPRTFQVRSAYAPDEVGFEQWLIKLDGVSSTGLDGHGDGLGESAPYGRIEYAYALMAADAGIQMAECRLLDEGPRRHFMTRRFDRPAGGGKLHLQSLSAMANLDFNLVGTHSYDQLFDVIDALGLGPDALEQAYRRMALNVAAANHDDHTKNHAFLATPEGRWSLAPAFDVTHAYRPDSEWTSRHLMSVNGRFEEISLGDLHAVGERHGVPGYRRLTREVLAVIDAWPSYASSAQVPDSVAATIASDLARFRPR